MNKLWADDAWAEYIAWQSEDRKTLKRINDLIKDIETNGKSMGIGKPEFLKYQKRWSRRIDAENRLVYDIDEAKNLWIISCKGHYED
jgi:toxin-antitoxin system, toxin component, Txe/YoeB family